MRERESLRRRVARLALYALTASFPTKTDLPSQHTFD